MTLSIEKARPPVPVTIQKRSEVLPSDTWDLRVLFPSESDWESAFKQLKKFHTSILKFQGSLSESSLTLKNCLEHKREIDMLSERIYEYARLRVSENSTDEQALDREARLASFMPHLQQACSFIIPEIQRISDNVFNLWLQEHSLEEWRFQLHKIRRTKPHTLSEPEERLLALVGEALEGAHAIFYQLTNADMSFGYIQDEETGQKIQLTQSTFSALLTRQHRATRKATFHKFYQEFSDHQYTLAAALASSVRKDVFYARARHFSSAREEALVSDHVPPSVYESLIATVRAHLPLLHQYYKLRQHVLQVANTHVYDMLVPLVNAHQITLPFEEAVEKILSAVTPLGGEYVNVLRNGLLLERWCDRYENKGKYSGAFSAGGYCGYPYLLMNYKKDVFSDLYTLAHETGHSMHTWYASRAQKFQNYRYPILLAEVASAFNEILLTEYLLSQACDPDTRAYLLNRQIDDLQGSLFRQTMFAEFEEIIHSYEERGSALTLKSLKSSYRSLLNDFFGSEVVIDDFAELEFLRIPHFYEAFYVYKYAIGISAAIALYHKTLKIGNASPYLDFLRSGDSQFPVTTLQTAGVDITSSEPIQDALQLFASRLAELENLLG